jgi:hypothetical protein
MTPHYSYQRGHVMVEIIQTEQGFQRNLRAVITHYLNPLRKNTARQLLVEMGGKTQSALLSKATNRLVHNCCCCCCGCDAQLLRLGACCC